jgi:AraC family transcriptional regulator
MRLDNHVEHGVAGPYFSVQLATHTAAAPGNLQLYERVHTIALQRRMHSVPSLGRFDVPGASPNFGTIGRVMLVPAETPLSIRSTVSSTRTVRCCFRPQHLEAIIGEPVPIEPDRLHNCLNVQIPKVRDLLIRIGDDLQAPGFAQAAKLETLGYELITAVIKHLRHLPRYRALAKGGLTDRIFKRLLDRINASSPPPALTELADLAGISVRHLTRAFAERTGQSVHGYVEQHRLLQAMQLLQDKNLSIRDVSSRLGFRSPAYFSTAFKRLVGQAPTEYRAKR